MSLIKRYFENEIEALAKATNYEFGFLMDRWNEECIEGETDFECFKAITLEHDW